MLSKTIDKAIEYINAFFASDSSGHDASHTMRVYRMGVRLALMEGADIEKVALACLLHDVDDRKISPSTYQNKDNARAFLINNQVDDFESIIQIIREVEFLASDSVRPSTLEGCCVQDADRLDAIGAIGIGRAFSYGGAHHRKMHDPSIPPRLDMDAKAYKGNDNGTTINHFYEKLLLLEGLMNTDSAKMEAKRRSDFMRDFLEEFLKEADTSL